MDGVAAAFFVGSSSSSESLSSELEDSSFLAATGLAGVEVGFAAGFLVGLSSSSESLSSELLEDSFFLSDTALARAVLKSDFLAGSSSSSESLSSELLEESFLAATGFAGTGFGAISAFFSGASSESLSSELEDSFLAGAGAVGFVQVWTLTQFFLFLFCENSLICLEGKSMTPLIRELPFSCIPPSNSLVSVSDN